MIDELVGSDMWAANSKLHSTDQGAKHQGRGARSRIDVEVEVEGDRIAAAGMMDMYMMKMELGMCPLPFDACSVDVASLRGSQVQVEVLVQVQEREQGLVPLSPATRRTKSRNENDHNDTDTDKDYWVTCRRCSARMASATSRPSSLENPGYAKNSSTDGLEENGAGVDTGGGRGETMGIGVVEDVRFVIGIGIGSTSTGIGTGDEVGGTIPLGTVFSFFRPT
jgi:hypothetical protein